MLRIIQGTISYIFVLFLYKGSCPATDNDPRIPDLANVGLRGIGRYNNSQIHRLSLSLVYL